MIRIILASTFIGLVSLTMSCSNPTSHEENKNTPSSIQPEGNFMGIEVTDTPLLLFPDFINTPMGEYNGTFNPDGTEFFYTVSNIYHNVIVTSMLMENGKWSNPEKAPFSVTHDEFDPLFSPDGQSLYFSSHRPFNKDGNTDASNIWMVNKKDNSWSKPEMIPLNGPRKGNYYSSLTSAGDIYFNIWNTGDMFKAIPTDTGYMVEKPRRQHQFIKWRWRSFHCS